MKIAPAATGADRVDDLEQVLPPSPSGLSVDVSSYAVLTVKGRQLRGVGRLNRVVSRLWAAGRNYFGYAHSHLLERDNGRLYYHAYHLDRNTGQQWMDIGSCELVAGRVVGPHSVGLTRSRDGAAWDAFFVADPFVLQT